MNVPIPNEVDLAFAETPRSLWIELTSKCSYDCVFCSRKLRRGNGEHLPFEVYERLVAGLKAPRRIVLNYSGESTFYPHLVPAIELAHARGAYVELVSAFSAIRPDLIEPLANSGLGRLTVSVHAVDPDKYVSIYRHRSFADLEERLTKFVQICKSIASPPLLDFAFVAMERNLDQLEPVTALGASLGVRRILVFPVKRRDEVPEKFTHELHPGGGHLEGFRSRVLRAVDGARATHKSMEFTICDPSFACTETVLGAVPVPYPAPLPEGARIHHCEQNPWDTAHILSNGDVVACEVLDHVSLGNLHDKSIYEIWQGEAYSEFRRSYREGTRPECRSCVWKSAYIPGPAQNRILASEGFGAQMLHGWHPPHGENVVWSTQTAVGVLHPGDGSSSLHLSGQLPPGPVGKSNHLTIRCNGTTVGLAENHSGEMIPIDLNISIPPELGRPWVLEFRCGHVYRPSQRGRGTDQRDLGFAMIELAS